MKMKSLVSSLSSAAALSGTHKVFYCTVIIITLVLRGGFIIRHFKSIETAGSSEVFLGCTEVL